MPEYLLWTVTWFSFPTLFILMLNLVFALVKWCGHLWKLITGCIVDEMPFILFRRSTFKRMLKFMIFAANMLNYRTGFDKEQSRRSLTFPLSVTFAKTWIKYWSFSQGLFIPLTRSFLFFNRFLSHLTGIPFCWAGSKGSQAIFWTKIWLRSKNAKGQLIKAFIRFHLIQ